LNNFGVKDMEKLFNDLEIPLLKNISRISRRKLKILNAATSKLKNPSW